MSAPPSGKGPVLLLGARSDIARAVAEVFARQGHPIQLAARDAAGLAADQADLALRTGATVTLHEFDATATETHEAFVAALPVLPEVVVCAVGYLGEQQRAERELPEAVAVMRANYEGPASILAAFANAMAERGSGTLVGISSVAGERGRGSNYVYGSAKAGFTAFLSGLRNRLARSGVHVVTVLPGFVDTQMTAHLELPPLLTAQPREVAAAVERAVRKRKDVLYVRGVWWPIMALVRTVPESLFKRLKL